MNIALWLIDINLLKKLYNIEKLAFYTTLLTTILAIIIEPIYWILVWVSITLIIFIRRVTKSDVNISIFRNKEFIDKCKLGSYLSHQVEWDLLLMKFSWWLNYLNIEGIFNNIEKLNKQQTIIISFSHMWDLDLDWLEMLNEMVEYLHENKITIYFSWLDEENKHLISKMESYKILKWKKCIYESTSEILKKLLEK
jgi:MFS superfamily sulfate permease-like transporter